LAHALDLPSNQVQDLALGTTPDPKTGTDSGSSSIGPSIYGEVIVPTTAIKVKEKHIQHLQE
jgi:hypothetical protein